MTDQQNKPHSINGFLNTEHDSRFLQNWPLPTPQFNKHRMAHRFGGMQLSYDKAILGVTITMH